MTKFSELPLSAQLKSNLAKNNFTEPTPIQSLAIEPALAGKDIVARMQTVNSSLQKITGSKDLKLQDLDKKLRAQHPNSTQLHETVRLIRTDVSEIDKELNANQSELAKLKEAFAMPGEK